MTETAPPEKDLLLTALVYSLNKSNDHESSISITLTIPGGVITGYAIGNQHWMDEVGMLVGSQAQGMMDLFASWNQIMSDARGAGEDEEEDQSLLTTGYVHLKGARFVVDALGLRPPPLADGIHWRGRLTQVSGWALGAFGPVPTDLPQA
jgi:hypothetical protein